MRLLLGLTMPHDKALAEFKIFCVFIALAFVLQYHRLMPFLTKIPFSWSCASGGLKSGRFNINEL
jgi:hypothetical protein